MATPNYSYEKRQRELAKKRKKEEKLKRKSTGSGAGEGGEPEAGEAADDTPPVDGIPPAGGSSAG